MPMSPTAIMRTARNFRQASTKPSHSKKGKNKKRRQFSADTNLDEHSNLHYMQRYGEAFTIYIGKRNIPVEVNITRIYCRKRKGRKKIFLLLTPFNNVCATPIQARYNPDNNMMKVSAVDHRLWKN